jgi:phasin family protein
MNEKIAWDANKIFTALPKAEIPAQLRIAAQDGVSKTENAYRRWNTVAMGAVKAIEGLVISAQMNARMLNEQLLADAVNSTDAIFQAAHKIAGAQTLSEAAEAQAAFAQTQLATVGKQGRRLFEIVAQVTNETANTVTAIATKTAEDFRKAA